MSDTYPPTTLPRPVHQRTATQRAAAPGNRLLGRTRRNNADPEAYPLRTLGNDTFNNGSTTTLVEALPEPVVQNPVAPRNRRGRVAKVRTAFINPKTVSGLIVGTVLASYGYGWGKYIQADKANVQYRNTISNLDAQNYNLSRDASSLRQANLMLTNENKGLESGSTKLLGDYNGLVVLKECLRKLYNEQNNALGRRPLPDIPGPTESERGNRTCQEVVDFGANLFGTEPLDTLPEKKRHLKDVD